MRNKFTYVFLLIILVPMIVFFAFFLFGCIDSYVLFRNLEYDDIVYEELTYERYEVKPQAKSSDEYFVYVQEYERSFYVASFTQSKLDKSALKKLESGTSIEVYYRGNGDHSICELKSGSDTLLSLSDYKKTNQNNQAIGIVVCSVSIVGPLAVILILTRTYFPSRKSARERKQKN